MSEDGIHRTETPEVPISALREAVVNSFAHARYDESVQHEIDIFSNRISIINPGSFANSFEPEDFAKRDLHSYLRNEVIARTLYLCKDVETFGSGLRKIYTLCSQAGVDIGYQNGEMEFTFEFYRKDRNVVSGHDTINDTINDTLNKMEIQVLSWLKTDPQIKTAELVKKSGKSLSTVNRCMASLRNKGLVERIGSNKSGYWKVYA